MTALETRIHKIRHGNETVLFFCDSLSIVKATEEDVRCIEQILDGLTESEARNRGENFLELYRKNFGLLAGQTNVVQNSDVSDENFSTLILHVSNDCNMKCAYCFANHGKYLSESSLMPKETAIEALALFYSQYRQIKEVKFFGGEPLLNLPAIEAVCSYVYERYDRGEITKLPRFKVITNGTLLNDQIIAAAIKYHIRIVFSLDGPAVIHDVLRYFPGKRPSYDHIIRNFWRWKGATGGAQPCSIETTYTRAHMDAGLSIQDVVEYFHRELKMEYGQVNVSLVNLPEADPLHITDIAACWSDYARELVEKARQLGCYCGDLKLLGLIYRLKSKKTAPDELCPAGKSWAAVSSTGNVYPCLMFMDRDAFFMGNLGDNLFQSSQYKSVVDSFQNCHPMEKVPCSTCFANKVCNKCAGINYFLTGSIDSTHHGQCVAMKQTIEILACAIADGIL